MALSYELDQHIPYTVNYNSINTEFELFYQNILREISHIPEQNLAHVKTKLRYTCVINSKIKIPFKYKLSNNNSIVILKQHKGRGAVKRNRSAYLGKCFTLLNTSQFNKLTKDRTLQNGKYKELYGKWSWNFHQIFTRTFITQVLHQVSCMGLKKSTNCHQMILSTNYHLDPLYKTSALQLIIHRNN